MDGQMRLWGIFYTSIDGSRRQYMQVGFTSPESAQNELETIYAESKDWHSKNDISNYLPHRCPAYLIGKDWEIKEIKLRKS